MNRFFIVGCPRSGTTLLQQILVRHPKIVVPPETAFFTKVVKGDGTVRRKALDALNRDLEIRLEVDRPLSDARAVGEAYDTMARAYCERLGAPAIEWFGDKTPDHLRAARWIRRVFPAVRFIVIHRDGRDVAVSLSKVPWSPDDPLVNFGIWRQAVHHQRRLLADPPAPILVLGYEELVRDPATQVQRVADFLDIPFEQQMLKIEDAPQGIPGWEMSWKSRATKPIQGDRVEVWRRELEPATVRRMERWGGHELTELGYEISASPGERASALGLLPTYARWAAWRAAAAVRIFSGRD